MTSFDSLERSGSPSYTLDPSFTATRYTGPGRGVYSHMWKNAYESLAAELMKDEPDCGEDEIVERVQELWDEARERETEPQSSLTLGQHEGSRLTLLQDYDREPTHLISTQPQPQQPESKKEKRKKKKKKSNKAKRLAASEATQDNAHDFQGSEAVRPGRHQFCSDEE